jgi:hypothetical protein
MTAEAAPTRRSSPHNTRCTIPSSEAKIPAERFDFHNAEGLQLAALLDRPAAGANGRAVCALLLLWQAQQGRTAHRQTA